MPCVADISQRPAGRPTDASELATAMLQLQMEGCHNINWVSPAHVMPRLLEALSEAIERGLRVPLVYNTNGYDGLDALRLLDGIVDIYMPDLKVWSSQDGEMLLATRDYAEVARQGLLEMHRQVGDLQIGPDGLARRGMMVRHLVLPGRLEGTRQILRWLTENLGTRTYLNLMDQYHPAYRACEFTGLCQPLSRKEYRQAEQMAREFGLDRLDRRRPPL